MENVIQPTPEAGTYAKSDANNKYVESFLKLYNKWRTHPLRIEKMLIVEEDYRLVDQLDQLLPDTVQPFMRSSILYKLLRIFDLEASDLPKIRAYDPSAGDSTINLMDELKDILIEVGEIKNVWADTLRGFRAEGTVFVQEGVDDDGDCVPVECCELAEMFFDPEMQELATESGRRGKRAKTIIREVTMSYAETIDLYPHLKGKIETGSPAPKDMRDNTNVDRSYQNDNEKVTFHFAYSIENTEEPVMAIYAGCSGTLVQPIDKGKDYPFWKKNKVGKLVPFLPFRVAQFAPKSERRGLYSPSIVGMAKDGVQTYQKLLNVSLPVFSKMVNPILLLLGDSSQREIEEMQIAAELQQLGVSQMIPISGQGAGVQELKPQSIAADFEQFRTIVMRDLSQRFDINLQALEEVEQTATETVAKVKIELKAIQGLYKINADDFFGGLISDMVAIYYKHGNKHTKRKLSISLGGDTDESIEIEMKVALLEVAEWTGSFKVETDLKLAVSTQDRANALFEIENFKRNALYGVQFTSLEQIQSSINAVYKLAVLRDLDDVFSKKALVQEAEMILQGQQPPPVQEAQPTNEGVTNEGVTNEEVAGELAPQSFLADAGIDNTL